METVVKDAIQKGINEICFTDHVDYGVRDDWNSGKPIIYRDGSAIVNVNYPLYVKQILASDISLPPYVYFYFIIVKL